MKKSGKKRIFAGLLAGFLVIGGLPVSFGRTIETKAEEVSETPEESLEDDKSVLESLNFELPADSSYSTDDIRQGRQYVQEYDELICTTYDRNSGQKNVYMEDGKEMFINGTSTGALLATFSESESNNKYRYSITESFDRDGDGCKDSLAMLYIHRNGGAITMDVMDLKTGEMVMVNQQTGGYVYTSTSITPWAYEGLLSMTAGDYDGDGREEVAVYTPNNYYTATGDYAQVEELSKLEISVFRITENSTSLGAPVSKIICADEDNCPAWRTAKDSKGYRNYWYLPYMSMETADLNHNGRDDLLTVASFQETHVLSKDIYTWKEVMDPNSCFGSVLDIYEGNTEGGFDQTINKKVLLSYNKDDELLDDVFYGLLRYASVIVADVTGPGSEEITFAGALTPVYYDESDVEADSTVAIQGILLNTNGTGAFMPRIGYVSYERLKKDEGNRFSSMDYTWSESFLLNNHKVYLDDDDANSLIPVTGYAAKGKNYADTILVGADRFRYDNDEGQLKYYASKWDNTGSKTTNRWYGQATVGNVNFSQDGKEEVFFTYYRKTKSKDEYYSSVWRIADESVVKDCIWGYKVSDNFRSLGLAVSDVNQDSTMIEYTDGNSSLFYSDVEVLSVLQAAPVYEELGEDYTENAETSYSKSSGSGKGEAYESVVSAGIVAGFEKEFNILGLQSVGGVEMESSISATLGKSSEYTVSKSYTTTYNACGTEDVAILYTTPYVQYNCKMYLPAYDLPSKEEYEQKKGFAEELNEHLQRCIDEHAAVTGGTYASTNGTYNKGYTTNVSPATYDQQAGVYYDYMLWLESTERTMAEFGQGGTFEWGQHIEGGWQDYFYNMPQTPIVTTVPVSTYDAVAKGNPKMDTLTDKVFGEDYQSGNPQTYLHSTSDVESMGGTDILTGKNGMGSAADDTGFIYSTAISASNSSPSQTISIEEEDAKTITRGIATESTFKVKGGDIVAGVTASYESSSSATCTSTLGCEYSGTVPNLPKGTPAAYGYGWKLVAYNMKVNGKIVPVVGYLTKLQGTPPPSTAENLQVTGETENSITIAWENGSRKADHYNVYRVDVVRKEKVYTLLESGIKPDENGRCTFTDDDNGQGLFFDTEYTYVVESANEDESLISIYSDELTGHTSLPEIEFIAKVEGLVEGKEYVPDTGITMQAVVDCDKDVTWRIRSYNWEYLDGSDWKDAEVTTKSMKLFADRSMDGKKYRCKIKLHAGSLISGEDYEIYTKPVTIYVKRYETNLTLTGSKGEGSVQSSAAYGPVGDKLSITAKVDCDDMFVTGGMVTFALYQDEAEEPVETISCEVNAQGMATTEISMNEPGIYRIKAQYQASEEDMLENCQETKEYTYFAYAKEESPVFTIDSENPATIDAAADEITYTGGEITPDIELTWNGTRLQEGEDYQVTYSDNTQTGNATATITGAGNFESMEEQTVEFEIGCAKEVPGTPETEFHVGESCSSLNELNAILPEGWVVSGTEEELTEELEIGTEKTVDIVYVGEDASNYTESAVKKQLTVTRADHEHIAGEILYTGKEDITKTCVSAGIGHIECTICGCVLESGIRVELDDNASGHMWMEDYTIDSEPTCVAKGTESIHCSNCTAIKPGSSREYGELKEHTGGTASCTEKAVCEVCQMEYGELEAHKWDEGKVTKEPTATEEGEKTYTCTECHQTKTESLAATGEEGGDSTDKPVDDGTDKPAGDGTDKPTGDVTDKPQGGSTTDIPQSDSTDKTQDSVTAPAVDTVLKETKTGSSYRVTKSGLTGGTVEFLKPKNKKVTSVKIPSTVQLNGITYKVTGIAKNAFKSHTKLTSVSIGANVESIQDKAFYKCSALKKITIPAKVKKIGKSAFEGCKKLKTINIKTKKLTSSKVGSNAFKGTPKNVKISIPKGYTKAYRKFLYKKGIKK